MIFQKFEFGEQYPPAFLIQFGLISLNFSEFQQNPPVLLTLAMG
jgi:hypothetical protein